MASYLGMEYGKAAKALTWLRKNGFDGRIVARKYGLYGVEVWSRGTKNQRA